MKWLPDRRAVGGNRAQFRRDQAAWYSNLDIIADPGFLGKEGPDMTRERVLERSGGGGTGSPVEGTAPYLATLSSRTAGTNGINTR
ncbi:MAG: hypothetical protein H0W15_01845 [Gemmatimonadales bacterium]|nr:hypothetical protein [Gemmatimonadales bacterium]